MKVLVIGQSEPALGLLAWLNHLALSQMPALQISHTADAQNAIELVRSGIDLTFIDITAIEISPEFKREKRPNLKRFKKFLPGEQEGVWLLCQIKPSRACKRKVAVLTPDAKRIRRLCFSLDLTGVIPLPIRPTSHLAIIDFLKNHQKT